MQWRRYAIMGLGGAGVAFAVTAGVYVWQHYFSKKPAVVPYNIILIISDQQTFKIRPVDGYHLPGHEALQQRGVTFTHHYIASAMCSPSRAAFLTGTPPQVNGVFDQMGYSYTPTLDPKRPNMGSVLKALGYHTAYFGKFEMDKSVLKSKDNLNTSTAIKDYGFDEFNSDGDTSGKPQQGYYGDPYYVGEAIRWLHKNANNQKSEPFFMVVSLLNPHDIMFADANIPGQPAMQQALGPDIFAPPTDELYQKRWEVPLSPTLEASLTANGMPKALVEYQNGWAKAFGFIPVTRKDMWANYYNYYLNAIRDNDQKIQMINDTLSQMNLWKNTIVIFTADHGDMGGSHGGLRGKGPMAYEENVHVPLIIAHPEAKPGTTCGALTSHLDLLPTLVGMTGLHSDMIAMLTGHDFSKLIKDPQKAGIHAVRKAILFNYVGLSTIDSQFLTKIISASFLHTPVPPLSELNRSKRGFMAMVFDGRYKYARYYAPNAFNTPQTMDEIFKLNDVQLFDLKADPEEAVNLAVDGVKNKDLIMQMNTLTNELIAQEVGPNNGAFLPAG